GAARSRIAAPAPFGHLAGGADGSAGAGLSCRRGRLAGWFARSRLFRLCIDGHGEDPAHASDPSPDLQRDDGARAARGIGRGVTQPDLGGLRQTYAGAAARNSAAFSLRAPDSVLDLAGAADEAKLPVGICAGSAFTQVATLRARAVHDCGRSGDSGS